MTDQTQDNLTDKATWLRLLYIVLFAIAFKIAALLIAIIMVVQFFTVLFTKSPNARLQGFGGDLGAYICDIARYLTFQTDHMPYPISDWGPGSPSATQKPTPRKTTAKKSPRKKAKPKGDQDVSS